MNKKGLVKRVMSVTLSIAVALSSGAFGGLVFEKKAEAATGTYTDGVTKIQWSYGIESIDNTMYAVNMYTSNNITDTKISDGELVVPSRVIDDDTGEEYPVRSLGSLDAEGNRNTSFLTGTLSTTGSFVVDLSGMEHLEEIVGYAFYNNGAKMDKLGGVILPDGVEKIGAHAFDGLSQITEMTLPETVETVGEKAFNGCSALNLTVKALNTVYADTDSLGVKILNAYGNSSTTEKWMEGYKAQSRYTELNDKTAYKVNFEMESGDTVAVTDEDGNTLTGWGHTYTYAFDGGKMAGVSVPANAHYIFEGYEYDGKKVYDGEGKPAGAFEVADTDSSKTQVSMTAVWSPETYDITYVLGTDTDVWFQEFTPEGSVVKTEWGSVGEDKKPSGYDYAEEITLPSSSGVVRDYYNCAGWYKTQEGAEALDKNERVTGISAGEYGDKTYYAGWKPKTFDVYFYLDGGSFVKDSERSVFWKTYGSALTEGNDSNHTDDYKLTRYCNVDFVAPAAAEVEKTGYNFAGWVQDSQGSPSPSKVPGETLESKLYYRAVWEPCDYDLVLDTKGGTVNSGNLEGYTYGEEAVLPEDVTRAGYDFDGWYDADTGNRTELVEAGSIGDRSFYAGWTVRVYGISYHLGGGTFVESAIRSSYTIEQTEGGLELPQEVVRSGYAFAGWKDKAGNRLDGKIAEGTTGDLALYAVWSPVEYPVELYADGTHYADESVWKTLYYTCEEELVLPVPERKGHDFAGWYGDSACEGEKEEKVSVGTTGRKVYYAGWTPSEYKVTLETMAQDAVIKSGRVAGYTYGNVVTLPSDLSRKNYDFAGWYDNSACEGKAVKEIGADETGDKVYYAKWTLKKLTITLNASDGQVPVPAVERKCTELFDLPVATRKGYAFLGWYTSAGEDARQIGAADRVQEDSPATLYAKWALSEYKVTFNYMEGKGDAVELPTCYGQPYGSLPSAVKYGHSFTGWYDEDGRLVTVTTVNTYARNQVLTAGWAKAENLGSIDIITDGSGVSTGDAIMDPANYKDMDSVTLNDNGGENIPRWYQGESGGYFYENALDEEGKKLYAGLFNFYQGGANIGETAMLSLSSKTGKEAFYTTIYDALSAFSHDHPEFTLMSSAGAYVLDAVPGQGQGRWYVAVEPVYWYEAELQKAVAVGMSADSTMLGIDSAVRIEESDDTYRKVRKIHDYIMSRFCYGKADSNGIHDNRFRDPAYGVVYSVSDNADYGMVCVGYARLFHVLCRYYGIEVATVSSDSHMWNEVKIDGKWYNMDCTSDDAYADEVVSHGVIYDFFLKGSGNDNFGTQTYVPSTAGKMYSVMDSVPMVNSKDYVYRVKKGGVIYRMADMEKQTMAVTGVTRAGKKKASLNVAASVNGFVVTKIANNAFKNCKKLKKVTVGKNVTSIGKNAFSGCKKLAKVTVKTNSLKSIGKNAFKGTSKKLTVKVPKKMVKKYTAKIEKAGNKKVVVK